MRSGDITDTRLVLREWEVDMGTVKALIPAIALTGVVSGILASGGTRGGVLALEQTTLVHHDFYWSWPLFLVTAGLSRTLLWMMDA